MANWEYLHLTHSAVAASLPEMQLQLNALGSLGWEVVAFTFADLTLGTNTFTAILKRQAASYPDPATTEPGWKPDPSTRHEQRHWDGLRWTEHVITTGVQSTDWPNVRPS